MSKPTHEVIHPSLYLMVEGVMQEMKVGARITLNEASACKMVAGGFVKCLGDASTVEIGKGETIEEVVKEKTVEEVVAAKPAAKTSNKSGPRL